MLQQVSAKEQLFAVCFSFVLALVVGWLARNAGFFSREKCRYNVPKVYWYNLLFFVLFFFVVSAIVGVLCKFASAALGGISEMQLTAFVSLGLNVVALSVLFYTVRPFLSKVWGTTASSWKSFFWGMGSWFVAYPFVLFVANVIALLALVFSFDVSQEQVAMQVLKESLRHPVLGIAMVLNIIFLVPCIEELAFRGLLHNWSVRKLGKIWGSLFTAVIFSLAHYSQLQGKGNIQILALIFVLACFLSYVYERKGTLWAPFGLHVMFNAVHAVAFLLFA